MRNNSLFKNTIYNGIYNGLNIIFPLITIPYISRVLLADGLGMVNYSRNIVSWFLIFASLGIPRYGVREVAKHKGQSDKLKTTFSELFLYNLISTSLSIIIYLIVINSFRYFINQKKLYYVTGIQLFLNIINVDYLYQGLEEYGYITKRSFVVKAISLISMFLFVKNKNDYIIYALIQSLAVAGNYLWNFLHLHMFVRFSFDKISLKKHTKSIFILLSTQLAVSLYSLLDTTMLGIWCSNSVIGYYSNVHKIIVTISTITASLGAAMLPRLVYCWNNDKKDSVKKLGDKALELILAICIPMMIGLFVLAPQLVSVLFGNDFFPCIVTLRIFAPFIVITTVGNLYGTQLLMTINEEKTLLITVVAGSILNMMMNSFLIPNFQQNGAAIASVATEFVVLLLQIYFVNKIIKLGISLNFVKSILCISVCIFGYLIVVVKLFENDIMCILLSLLGVGIIYVVLGFLLRNSAICYIVNIISKKFLKIELVGDNDEEREN